jgi:hypothetical protein
MRWYVLIAIKLGPCQLDPGDWGMVIEFLEELHKEASFSFGSAQFFPGYQTCALSIDITFAPDAMFSESIDLFQNLNWDGQRAHIEGRESRKD